MIWTMSSSPFRSEESRSVVVRILDYMFGGQFPDAAATVVNTVIRKSAHVTEYAIFTGILYYAIRPSTESGRIWNRSAAIQSGLIGAGFAILDEIHQAFVPGRGTSASDVAIDCIGVLLSILVLYRTAGSGQRFERP